MATRRIVLALIGLLSACILVGAAGAAVLAYLNLAGPRSGEQLLVLDADQHLSLVTADGRAKVLAEDVSPDLFRYPALARDGRRLAYISQDANGTALHSLDLESGARTELYRSRENPPLYATWAPDGTHISFLSNQQSGGLGVRIVPADGSRQPDLIGTTAESSYFAWQPNSSTLLLHSGGSSFQEGKVATYRPGQSEPLQVLDDPGFFQAPAWSVDGSAFFYVAQPPISGQPSPAAVESVLTRVSLAGGNPQPLAIEKQAAMLFTRAPASDHIAYLTIGPDGFGALKLVDLAGAPARTLSRANEQVMAFFWSPQGDRLAYLTPDVPQTGNAAPTLTWHIVERESGAVRDLGSFMPSRSFDAMLRFFDAYTMVFDLWSPSGRELVYSTSEGIYVVDVANGEASRRSDGVLAMWAVPR